MISKIPTTSLAIRGVSLEHNALTISDDVTDEELHEIGQRLATMDGALAWWLGDYGLTIQGRKGEHYIKGQAQVLGISEGHWRDCVSVCRFFKPSDRTDTLSFTHHRVMMQIARSAPPVPSDTAPDAQAPAPSATPPANSPPAPAQSPLEICARLSARATSEGLSVSELRKHGRVSLASPAKYAAQPEVNSYDELDAADKWAIRHKDLVLEPDAAFYFKVRWQALIELLDRVKEAASKSELAQDL